MASWHEYVERTGKVPRWPYPARYDKVNEVTADVLVIGGGIAGCHASLSARRRGADVLVVEKGATKWSGNGGAGVDHWLSAATNPCSKVSPEDLTARVLEDCGGYDCGPLRYVNAREGWEALLDCERMGVRIRDTEGEFRGADFRDPETGLLFAYDYGSRCDLRVWGYNMKPCLHREMQRLGVRIADRVMVTSLLSAGTGGTRRVVGATGLHTRTGEFFLFRANSTVLATGLPGRIWHYTSELRSSFRDPNCTGDGLAAAWNAGAAVTRLEESYRDSGALAYIGYGVGNAHNSWHGCSIVDAKGVEVPWVDRDGRTLESVEDRFRPSPGQRFMIGHGQRVPPNRENHVKELAPDLPERIRSGEITLPLYADLSRLPELERRAIFGLMVGNEGKTRVPVYETLTRAGFDPDRDMLQVPVMESSAYGHSNFWSGMDVPQWRIWGCGGLVVDWDFRSTLPGLYAAGGAVFGAGAHSSAAASGRFAGRTAAEGALAVSARAELLRVDEEAVERERARVYAPLAEKPRSIGWKELNAGICRVMQDYCGEHKSEGALREGLRILGELRESEAARVRASNPHELARAAECSSIITVGQAVMHACLARRASSRTLGFLRLDFPELDPPAWRKHVVVSLRGEEGEVGALAHDYHLRAPFSSTHEENYRLHCRA